MVFVHARKETVNAARALKDAATAEGMLDDYSCQDHPRWDIFRRSIGESRNKEMKLLFDDGFGIHHAGMLRSDRNLMERMFQERAIKVRAIIIIPTVINTVQGFMLYCHLGVGSQSTCACRCVLIQSYRMTPTKVA